MVVSLNGDDCTVESVDDSRRLHVESSLGVEQVAERLTAAGWGEPRDLDTVWISVAALRSAGEKQTTLPDWSDRFEAMVEYAGDNGWLSDTGKHLAAHIESGKYGGVFPPTSTEIGTT